MATAIDLDFYADRRMPEYTGIQLLEVETSWNMGTYSHTVDSYSGTPSKPIGTSTPHLDEVEKACRALSLHPNAAGVVFQRYGYVGRASIRRLWTRCKIATSANALKDLKAWLTETCNLVGTIDGLMDWFDRLLSCRSDILKRVFQPHGIHIDEVISLIHEEYLNDEVIRALLEAIEEHYGTVLCIPPLVLSDWIHQRSTPGSNGAFDWNYGQAKIAAGGVSKAFAVVHMNSNHWGVLCVDFSARRISFGDSMDKGTVRLPCDAEDAIVYWLRHIKVWNSRWSTDIVHLDVPQQRSGSGSCGVIALNTIERSIDPDVERWTDSDSQKCRIQYFQVVSGFCKVRNTGRFCLFF